jgi:hypothetical protein
MHSAECLGLGFRLSDPTYDIFHDVCRPSFVVLVSTERRQSR